MQFDQEAEGRLTSVEITSQGIVAGLMGRFKTSKVDAAVIPTPGAVITANSTLPSALAPGTGDVFLAIRDDVFNQLFASMRIAGRLNSGCRDSGKTVGDILPLDCQSLSCVGGRCEAPTCSDNTRNGAEGDVDCGGSCAPCADGLRCTGATQCQSSVCDGGHCVVPTCSDGAKNGREGIRLNASFAFFLRGFAASRLRG